MNKYIDADKLIAEIERLSSVEYSGDTLGDDVANCALNYVLEEIIPSLQQEQPKVDLVAKLEHHFATTPKEQLEKEWKELEHWNSVGPTVQEFLYGKQSEPEVDLEKLGEIARHLIAVKDHKEDMRLDEGEWLLLERIGYPERFNARKED